MAQAKDTTKLWLYLARRDKTGIRVLSILRGRKYGPARIHDISTLQLPAFWQTELDQIIFDSRMLWETWLESADSYDDLREALKKRGYSNIPISSQPEISANNIRMPEVNTSYLPQTKTMVRKRPGN